MTRSRFCVKASTVRAVRVMVPPGVSVTPVGAPSPAMSSSISSLKAAIFISLMVKVSEALVLSSVSRLPRISAGSAARLSAMVSAVRVGPSASTPSAVTRPSALSFSGCLPAP